MSDPYPPSQPNPGDNNQPYAQPQAGQQYAQPYGQPQYQQPYGQLPPAPQPGNGIAITALVLGIVAVVFSIIPFVGWLAFLLGPAAVVFGIIGLVKKFGKNGMNLTGIILGALAIVITVVMTIIIAAAANTLSGELNKTLNEEHAVQYKVTTTGSATVTYSSADGSSEEEITADWTKDISTTGFDAFSLTVMGSFTESTSVTCEILVDGKSVSTNTGTGKTATASCSGSTIQD